MPDSVGDLVWGADGRAVECFAEGVRGGLGVWGVGEVSLRPRNFQRIPVRTLRTARAACPKGTPAMLIRDRLDVLFEDEEFADLYPDDGRPGLSPGQLALVSVLQFAENLSDRAAADAVRTRIDWKYAIGACQIAFDVGELGYAGGAGGVWLRRSRP